ncbi:LuxR C-terminal-related transcriptional regulator [Limosilactobacillus sp.]|uniref:LuxR C-terminal-related transcriptional regulator n=1 Tax=Limosilactobacillus sp. TaxID=2773925 RepID=UPI0025BC5A81|nr:response regulator transcription factor [Limosilactobacillus sp.]MCH3922764.1 response regulator transcription factor [Limosilactobacillus sp.]MCH3927447.1 response regulator transcription factor [Limosilactobacillus sp.]
MKNVLIADEQPIVRLGLTTLIDGLADFQLADQVADSADACMRLGQGDIDIAIMGLTLPPGENGLVTIQRIHDLFPAVRVMILSHHEEQEIVNRAIHNGALSYIFKSSPTSEIIAGLTSLARGELYLDNNIMITGKDRQKIQATTARPELASFRELSKRERELFPFIALGYSNKEIASRLFISTKTVEAHKAKIMHKLDLHNQADLIRFAIRHHLITV